MRKFAVTFIGLVAAFAVVILLLVVNCSGDKTSTPPDPLEQFKERLSLTPRANEEAELMALWLSGEITAPTGLYNELVSELDQLRDEWADSISALDSIHFRHPRKPSSLYAEVTDETIEKIRSGQYRDWDSLNELFHLEAIDTTSFSWIDHPIFLYFRGNVNSDSLAARYAGLPELDNVAPFVKTSPWTTIYPERLATGPRFLFSLSRNIPFDLTTRADFWYFREEAGHYSYIGHYYFNGHWEPDSLPDWAEEALPLFCGQHPGLGSPYCPEDSSR